MLQIQSCYYNSTNGTVFLGYRSILFYNFRTRGVEHQQAQFLRHQTTISSPKRRYLPKKLSTSNFTLEMLSCFMRIEEKIPSTALYVSVVALFLRSAYTVSHIDHQMPQPISTTS